MARNMPFRRIERAAQDLARMFRTLRLYYLATPKSVLNQAHCIVDKFQRQYGMTMRDDRDDNMLAAFYAFRALAELPAASTAAEQRTNVLKALTALTRQRQAYEAGLVTILAWVRDSFRRPNLRSMLKGSRSIAWLVCVTSIGLSHNGNALSLDSSDHCTALDPKSFLQHYQSVLDIPPGIDPIVGDPRAVSRAFAEQRGRVWLGIEWSGPTSGTLAVIDCNGKPVTSLALGGVERIRLGPRLPDGSRSYEILYTAGSGTGFSKRDVALVQFDGNAIRVVWRHILIETVSETSNQTRDQRFTWRYSARNHMLRVQGMTKTKSIDGGAESQVTKLGPKSFCWLRHDRIFAACESPSGRASHTLPPDSPPASSDPSG